MVEVKSSNLSKIGYDELTSTLKVVFKDGQEYWYSEVPSQIHSEMMKSESIGKFFVKFVKGGNFQYKKIESTNKNKQ